jgi:hypothetical protein
MTWADDLEKIRYFLRDPDGALWSEAVLRHLYNDVQQDLVNRTLALEEVATQRVPGLFQGAYLYEWEYSYLGVDRAYQALTRHDDYALCAAWEAQEVAGIASDATDVGSHFTQPWEAYMTDPGDPIRIRWPRNLNSLQFIAYDEDTISGTTKKAVQSRDSSYILTEGSPSSFYAWDQDDFVLYPRPSTGFSNEISGEGVAFYADGDSEDVTTGTIATRALTYDGGDGAAVDIVDSADNLFMVYRASPAEISGVSDEPSVPVFLRKYVRYGVIGRAYAANTDGRIRSLGDLWMARYEMGINLTKRFLRNRRQDRDYRLNSGRSIRRSRGPQLPTAYPAV